MIPVLIFILKRPMLGLVLICHCNAVSERRIRRSIRNGATTLGRIARSCGAGGGCGGCQAAVETILEEELAVSKGEVDATPLRQAVLQAS